MTKHQDEDRAYRGTQKSEREAISRCEALGLHPFDHPLGCDHHTDVPFSETDLETGDALAFFLGTLFSDIEGEHNDYWYHQRTSVNEWARVARALRIHGLAICDATNPILTPPPK